MSRMSIYLLGNFQVRLDDQLITRRFRTDKERALFAYLAVEAQRPHARETLAELFWPERYENVARANLRQALLGIRKAIGDQQADVPYLTIIEDRIQFNPQQTIWMDTLAFMSRIQETTNHPHRSIHTCFSCIQHLQEAVDLYRQDFLDGMYLTENQGFHEWQLFQREQYFRHLIAALDNLSAFHANHGDYETAQKFAWQYVKLEPLEENAHRRLMELLALSGRRSAAMEQFQTCRQILEKELQLKPSEETLDLFERIRTGEAIIIQEEADISESQIPPQLTSFVGREAEIEWFGQHLSNPTCRLINLIGRAGVGKTRLAMEAAKRYKSLFPDGVWFVDMEAILSADLILPALAKTLGLTIATDNPRLQLFKYLQSRTALLVIDNFDHLITSTEKTDQRPRRAEPQAHLMLDILKNAAHIKILITSRERLNYQATCLLTLQGLPYPETTNLKDVHAYPACQLFIQRAIRVRPGFTAHQNNLPSIVRICQLLHGNPLAIELAANQLREFDCVEIAEQLYQDGSILRTSLEDIPIRHRSMQAAINASWDLLTLEQKTIFANLSIFHGGFTSAAAETLAGASRAMMSDLVDKSMVQITPNGRYYLSPLLERFARIKFQEYKAGNEFGDANQEKSTGKRGVKQEAYQYYLNDLRNKRTMLDHPVLYKNALKEITSEIENIHYAIDKALELDETLYVKQAIADLERYRAVMDKHQLTPEQMSEVVSVIDGRNQRTDSALVLSDPSAAHTTVIAGGFPFHYEGRLEAAHHPILVTDLEGRVIETNSQALLLSGYSRDMLIQLSISDLILFDELHPGNANQQPGKLINYYRENIPIEITTVPGILHGQFNQLSFIRKITREDGPKIDPVSGFPNRENFFELLRLNISKAARNAQMMGVLYLRVANLELIRESETDNDAILELSDRLRQSIRTYDIVARIGKLEFGFILNNLTKASDTEVVAQKIFDKLKMPYQKKGGKIKYQGQIGMSVYPIDGDHWENLWEIAVGSLE